LVVYSIWVVWIKFFVSTIFFKHAASTFGGLASNSQGWSVGITKFLESTSTFLLSRWCQNQPSVFPPLTESLCPVMNRADSEARKATASPISSGSPILFIGTLAA
jgi:hypothetical protein